MTGQVGMMAKWGKVNQRAVDPAVVSWTGLVLNGNAIHTSVIFDGFPCSQSTMATAVEDLVSTQENNPEMVVKPKGFAPDMTMYFAGIRKGQDRRDVIAHLATYVPQ